VPGAWLENNELWLGLIKPVPVALQAIFNDQSRTDSVALVKAVLGKTPHDQELLALKSANKPALLVVPEYAFGSGDFTELDAAVKEQSIPLILMAGFGATRGETLRTMIETRGLQCGWREGLANVDDDAIYNGGWCWVHDPRQADERDRCYVFLKNWPEQRHERTGFPNFRSGNSVLQIAAADCDFLALICADVLCDHAHGPHGQVTALLQTAATRPCLVAVLMLEDSPANVWPARLDHLVGGVQRPTALVTCNHQPVKPETLEAHDAHRCMTGAMLPMASAGHGESEPHAHCRRIRTGARAGYVLRSNEPGIAGGILAWRESALTNRFTWLAAWRQTWANGVLGHALADPHLVESVRWCQRVRRPAWLSGRDTAWRMLQDGFQSIQTTLRKWSQDGPVWPGALTGLGLEPATPNRLEDTAASEAMHGAFYMLACATQALNLELQSAPAKWHFLRPNNAGLPARAVIAWSSVGYTGQKQWRTLQAAAQDWKLPHATLVLGHNAAGMNPIPARVKADAQTDITAIEAPDEESIDATSNAPVYWMPFGALEDILVRDAWDQLPPAQGMPALLYELHSLLEDIPA